LVFSFLQDTQTKTVMQHGHTVRPHAGEIRQLLVQQGACKILIPAAAKDKDSDKVQQQAVQFRQPVLLPGVKHTTQAQRGTLHKPDALTTRRSLPTQMMLAGLNLLKFGCCVSGWIQYCPQLLGTGQGC
jgi:hypothetical protein